MIGISLPYKWLCGGKGLPVSPSVLLPQLRRRGVGSIELRTVPIGGDPTEVLRVADLLWEYGFSVTVHANAKSAEGIVTEVLQPISAILKHLRQRELIVTVHPIVGDNAAMLRTLSDEAAKAKYPVRFALENQRLLPDKSEGDSLALVLDAVRTVDRDNVGICFDMGHYAWYAERYAASPSALPPKGFLSRVIHTHIHACAEGTTHFPLDGWGDPLGAYLKALDHGYFGVYNLELSPKRYAHRYDPIEAYFLSVDTLRANFPFSASIYEDIKRHYDDRFHRALQVLSETEGCHAALFGATAYLFNTNGFTWMMDPAFRHARYLADAPSQVRKHLGGVALTVLTHGHADHFEESTVRALSDTEMLWLAPEFLVDRLIACGVRRERILTARVGERVSVDPLTFTVLEGRHFRPDTGKGTDAVGYLVTADGAPSIAFPGDVRDYGVDGLSPVNADYCFAHVWLTDHALDRDRYLPKCREFAEFMLRMSSKHLFLTHLYENARKEDKMWQIHHAHAAKAAVHALSAATRVTAPTCGEMLKLS